MAQIFPPSKTNTNRLTTVILWYIWQGMIFRVPKSTLQKSKEQGGWGLDNVAAKCKTLLLNRMWTQRNKTDTATASWLQTWNLNVSQANPPVNRKKLQQLEYLQIYAREMAYISPQDHNESAKTFKKRIHKTLPKMERAATGNSEIRIIKQLPQVDWNLVWKNLHTAPISETLKSAWYNIIHDLIPTKERLAAIHLADSNLCDKCAKTDTLIHRLTDCSPSADIWHWTRIRLAIISRTDQRYIPIEWINRPHFHLWPPQRHKATMWIIAHLVWCITKEHRLSLTDYIDFLRRAKMENVQQAVQNE